MSRVGKNEVVVPEGVNFSIEGRILSVKGKLGAVSYTHLRAHET